MAVLSIIVPNFNHASFLPDAVESSLRKCGVEVELLAIDDASADGSWAVLQQLAAHHPRLRLFRHDRNVGVERSLNHGLQEAQGEFVLFRAADDVTVPDFAPAALQLLASHPTAAFCLGDTRFFAHDPAAGRRQRAGIGAVPTLVAPACWNNVFGGNELSACSAILRRSAVVRAGGFDPDLHWISDWALLVSLALQEGFVYLPEPSCAMRLSAASYNSAGSTDNDRQRRIFIRLLSQLATLDEAPFSALRTAGILDLFNTALGRLAATIASDLSPRARSLLEFLEQPTPPCRRRCGMPAALRDFLVSAETPLRAAHRIAVFGAGGHTALLLREWRDTAIPLPALVLDSRAPASPVFEGLPCRAVDQVAPTEFDTIVLSSKSYEPELARLAELRFPQARVLRIWT